MEFSSTTLQLLTAMLYVPLAIIFVLWWWVFSRVFVHKKDNDSRSAFMLIMFLCILLEMWKSVDPFTDRNITSWKTLRCCQQSEMTLLLPLLLVGADQSAWLNYFAVEGLLLKPQRTYRHVLFLGAFQLIVLTIVLVIFAIVGSVYFQGMAIGCILASLFLIIWAITALFISLREVSTAMKIVEKANNLGSPDLTKQLDIEHLPTEDEQNYAEKTRKKSLRMMKYFTIVFLLLIIDLGLGAEIEGSNAIWTQIIYGFALKILLGVMMWQRRPIEGGRQYEHNVHKSYKPFETFFYGDTATKTVGRFKTMYRSVRPIRGNPATKGGQKQAIDMTAIRQDDRPGPDDEERPVSAPIEVKPPEPQGYKLKGASSKGFNTDVPALNAQSSDEVVTHRRVTSVQDQAVPPTKGKELRVTHQSSIKTAL